jgi:two-component system, cell cycle sensor histidine kinase and response regulator CckA
MAAIRVLIIEDSDDDALLIARHLRRGGIELTYERVQTARAVAEALANRPPEVVICDYSLPAFSPQEALTVLHDSGLDAPFILVSGAVGEETAAAVMKAGAHDVILKDRLTRLVPAVQRELRDAQVRQHRQRAETALRDSEDRFRLLAEHVRDVVFRYRIAPPDRLEYISPVVADLTGYAPEELHADPAKLFAMMEADDRLDMEASWNSPNPAPLVGRWRRRDGRIVWIEQRAVAVRDDEGQIVAIEGILREVTEQILANQERERLDRELRQAERLDSLGRLAGGVAHDFNNLLAVIMAFSRDVADALTADHPCRPDVDKISLAAERAAALTRQLLIFSRLEPSQLETLDLNTVVTGIEQLLRRTIGEDIEFLTILQPDLYPVTIDRSKIEQVAMNLVVNARAAMPHGGRLCIETANIVPGGTSPDAAGGRRGWACLTVTDTGSGMPPDVAQRAFEPFFTTKGPGQGTGLGLATAYGVVKDAGGEITLRSEPGKGTTLRVLLPAATHGLSTTVNIQAAAPRGAGQAILVVEDDEDVRDVATRILTRANYQVVTAATPKDALEICTNPVVHIDALLTDVVMPEMSGIQLAGRVREIRENLPIMLMSGYTAGSLPGGPEPTIDLPLIRKPFSAATLLHQVHDLLR